MPSNNGTPVSPVVLHEIMDIHVWVPCDDEGQPLIVQEAHPPQNPFGVGFATPEVAFAANLGQDTIAHTTLWSVLRATPPGIGFILEAGQDGEIIFYANEIDDVLGVDRSAASELSRAERIARAYGRSDVERDLSTADKDAIAAVRAPFPAGFDILLGDLNPEKYAAYVDAAGAMPGVSLVGQRVDSSLERVLLVVDGTVDTPDPQLTATFESLVGTGALPGVEVAVVRPDGVPEVFRGFVDSLR